MSFTEHEMHGLIAGKCVAGDMKVNEELPAYLVRKMLELESERDMYRNAEMSWEKAMMSAIGEDGTGSVTKAISDLKAERDALAAKGMELCREAAHVYEKYNVTQMPDMDLVDCQTIQEFSDLAGGSIKTDADAYAAQLRAEGVEMFAKHFNCADISDDILEFAANLRKENGNG